MHNIGIEYPARGEMRFCDIGSPPDPGPTQILIRTRYSGITNGTERHALMADFGFGGGYPGRHGYQHVGIVEKAGKQVKDFAAGDTVFFGHYVGHRGWHIVDVGIGASHLCIRLSDDVEHEFCALFGVAGVALRHVRRIRVAPAQNVWVAGMGPIGQFAAQAARAFGAYVTVTDVDQRRLDIAVELGAHRAINVSDQSGNELMKQAGPYDCIVDACGVPSLFKEIHKNRLLIRRGVIGALAVRAETTFHWSMLHGLEGSIEVSCHFGPEDLNAILHFLRLGTIRIEPLVTHRVPITEAPHIYETMRDRRADLLGVILNWQD